MIRPIPLAATVLAVLAGASTAQAQSVNRNGRTGEQRMEFPFTLNRVECLLDNGYDYRVSGLPNPTLNVQVYVAQGGSTCTQQDRTNGVCIKVGEDATPVNGAIPNLVIAPADIVRIFDEGQGSCTSSVGAQTPQQVTLYFFQGLANDPAVASFTTDTLDIDLVGPAAPTVSGTSASSDTSLVVRWTDIPSDANDLDGFAVFCDPQVTPTTETTATTGGTGGRDAGVGGTQADMFFPQDHAGGGGHGGGFGGAGGGFGGAGGGFGGAGGGFGGAGGTLTTATTTSSAAATSSSAATSGAGGGAAGECPGSLPVGEVPSASPCAQVTGSSSTSATVDGLDSTQEYTFAVASVDRVGNFGPLSSDVVCSVPEPTTDFFAAYRDAGGLGGGGCGCTVVGAPPLSRLAPFGFFVTLALVAARRRSREAA